MARRKPISPEEAAARDAFIARHGADRVARGTYTVLARNGSGSRAVIGHRRVEPGMAEADAPIIAKGAKRGRGKVPVAKTPRKTAVGKTAARKTAVAKPAAGVSPQRSAAPPVPAPAAACPECVAAGRRAEKAEMARASAAARADELQGKLDHLQGRLDAMKQQRADLVGQRNELRAMLVAERDRRGRDVASSRRRISDLEQELAAAMAARAAAQGAATAPLTRRDARRWRRWRR